MKNALAYHGIEVITTGANLKIQAPRGRFVEQIVILAQALGVTKFTNMGDIILVTLCCAA